MIEPAETEIIGRWLVSKGRVVGDTACLRIDNLANYYLVELGRDASGWEVLYRDPNDNRLWELTYPQSHLHGGGPPTLRCLTEGSARHKYGDLAAKQP